jgi:hypothetical protein
MSIRSIFVGLAVLAVSATLFAPNCIGGQIVDAGNGAYFYYGWGPLNSTHVQWDTHAYVDNLTRAKSYYEPSDMWFGYTYPPTSYSGSVEWRFRTDSGSPFTDAVEVTYRANSWAGANGCWGEWSTDGDNYTQFFATDQHIPVTTVALKDSGYTGGQDLYLKFSATRAGGTGGYDSVQLFRQDSTTEFSEAHTFAVSGGSQIPEPSALAALLGMGLIGYWWRRRKAA